MWLSQSKGTFFPPIIKWSFSLSRHKRKQIKLTWGACQPVCNLYDRLDFCNALSALPFSSYNGGKGTCCFKPKPSMTPKSKQIWILKIQEHPREYLSEYPSGFLYNKSLLCCPVKALTAGMRQGHSYLVFLHTQETPWRANSLFSVVYYSSAFGTWVRARDFSIIHSTGPSSSPESLGRKKRLVLSWMH